VIGIIIFTLIGLILSTVIVLVDNHFNKENDEILNKLPGYNCGACGFGSCQGMQEAILNDKENYKKCKFIKEDAKEYFDNLWQNILFVL